MKRNLKTSKVSLKEEIEKIIYQPGVGAVWLHDETMKQLLSLFSDTVDEILDPKPSKPKGGKKVTDIIEITIYNYDKMLRDRKKDLLDNTKTKEQT